MTEEEIAKFEYLFNCYSARFSLYDNEKKELISRMGALKSAVKIFGYKFEPKGIVNEYGFAYQKFELVKINE